MADTLLPLDSVKTTVDAQGNTIANLPGAPAGTMQGFFPSVSQSYDNHNLASGNTGFASGVGDLLNQAKDSLLLSGASAIDSVNDTAGLLFNLFLPKDLQFAQHNAVNWLTKYDSDLGNYYRNNKDSVDLNGFVLSSLVPGTLGTKAYNLGAKALSTAIDSGTFGENIAASTNLVRGMFNAKSYIGDAAYEAAATATQTPGLLNLNRLKAIGIGVGANALDAAAFEIGALALTNQSSFVQSMDTQDLALDVAKNALFGGVLGGLFKIPAINKELKNKVSWLDFLGKPGLENPSAGKNIPENVRATLLATAKGHVTDYLAYVKQESANLTSPDVFGPHLLPPTPEAKAVLDNHIAQAQRNRRNIDNQLSDLTIKMSPNEDVGRYFAKAVTGAEPKQLSGILLTTSKLAREADVPALLKAAGKDDIVRTLKANGVEPDTYTGVHRYQLWNASPDTTQVFDDNIIPGGQSIADMVQLKKNDTIKKAVINYAKKSNSAPGIPIDVMSPNTAIMDVQARYHQAYQAIGKFKSLEVAPTDFPYLENGLASMQLGKLDKVTVTGVGEFTSSGALDQYIKRTKDEELAKAIKISNRRRVTGEKLDDIAMRANVTPGYLKDTARSNIDDRNYYAWQSLAQQKSLTSPAEAMYLPKYLVSFSHMETSQLENRLTLGPELYTNLVRSSNSESVDNALHNVVDSLYGQVPVLQPGSGAIARGSRLNMLPAEGKMLSQLRDANRYGSRPTMWAFANGRYGSFNSHMQNIGNFVFDTGRASDELSETALAKAKEIILKNPSVAAEFAATTQLVRARAAAEYQIVNSAAEGEAEKWSLRFLDKDGNDLAEPIEFVNPMTADVWRDHIALNNRAISANKTINSSQGIPYNRKAGVAYGIPVDPTKLKHFAFVKNTSIQGAGETTMVHAPDAASLEKYLAQIQSKFPEWEIYTKPETEEYFKAMHEYQFDRTINSQRIDASLASHGISATPIPRTNPKDVAEDLINFHKRQFRLINANVVKAKYGQLFDELGNQARITGAFSESKYPDVVDMALGDPKNMNPYIGYIKTALNISTKNDIPIMSSANKFVNDAASAMFNKGAMIYHQARPIKPDDLAKVSDILEAHGFKPGYYDAAMHLMANAPANREVASKFVRAAGGILSTTFLRWDPFNALVNRLGSIVMTNSEAAWIKQMIKDGDNAQLGSLANVQLPGTDSKIFSPVLSVWNGMRDVFTDAGREKGLAFKQWGVNPDIRSQIDSMLSYSSITGQESSRELTSKMQNLAKWTSNHLEIVTGNKAMEYLNRYTAANWATEVAQAGIRQGVITPAEGHAFIRSFVNKTQVNLNPAQRPGLFQGPIGMMMGLFQSYQFNLMQQLFKYSENGMTKQLAMYAGLQGSFFGLNGLPGYAMINNYAMALNGNTEHKGIDDILSEGVSAGAASWILYGAPSNLLHANLFVRGDATPQSPSSLGDFPMIGMWADFFRNLYKTTRNMANGGGVWNSLLFGLEHNGINRPLAGIAQTIRGLTDGSGEVKSYDNTGKFISSNDLYSLATLARLAGGHPLGEAAVRNEMWKIQSIRSGARQALNNAGVALRLATQSGGQPSPEMITNLFQQFTDAGMNPADFNRWMLRKYNDSNQSEVQKMQMLLGNPVSIRMQQLLGSPDVDADSR